MISKTMAILLGMIERQPMNPYELNKRLSAMHIRSWYAVAASTVYAALKTAEKKEYAAGAAEKSGNMPEKTVYTITQKGREVFLETITGYISNFDYDITPFSIAIFFLDALERETAAALLEKRILLLEKYERGIAAQTGRMAREGLPALYRLNVKQNLYIVQAQKKGAAELLGGLRG